MNKYELAVIVKPNLEETVLKEEFQKIQDYITRFGGTIEKIDDLGRRSLAYEIQKFNDGFYNFISFNAPADAPAQIENRIRILENVLRFLIIRKDA